MGHTFEVDIAVKYGVNAAILLNNIYFWCQKNEANNHNFFDGSYWTYNSRNAFTKIFPYLSERQIKTALDKLIADGVIKTGHYNEDVWNKSTWYALTDKGWSIMQRCSIDDTEMSNRSIGNVKSYTYIKPDGTADINPDISFERFWKAYPRKVAKQPAQKAWKALNPSDDVVEMILADIDRRIGVEWKKKDMQYIPHPSTYLNQRRWEDESEDTDAEFIGHTDEIVITPEQQRIIDEINARGENFG